MTEVAGGVPGRCVPGLSADRLASWSGNVLNAPGAVATIFGTLLLALVGAGVLLVGRLRGSDAEAPEPGASAGVAVERAGEAPGRPRPPRFQQVAEPVPGRADPGAEPPKLEDTGERIEPGKGMTAEELADPGHYFEDAASRPELLRKEELTEARKFYVRYHRQLEGDWSRDFRAGTERRGERPRQAVAAHPALRVRHRSRRSAVEAGPVASQDRDCPSALANLVRGGPRRCAQTSPWRHTDLTRAPHSAS